MTIRARLPIYRSPSLSLRPKSDWRAIPWCAERRSGEAHQLSTLLDTHCQTLFRIWRVKDIDDGATRFRHTLFQSERVCCGVSAGWTLLRGAKPRCGIRADADCGASGL